MSISKSAEGRKASPPNRFDSSRSNLRCVFETCIAVAISLLKGPIPCELLTKLEPVKGTEGNAAPERAAARSRLIVRRQFSVIAGEVPIDEHRTLHLGPIATIWPAGANQAVPLRRG